MMDQTEPGSEIVDLRDVLDKYNEILSRPDIDREDWEIDYLAIVDGLKKQLFSPLEQYAEYEPIMIEDSYFEQYARDLAEDLFGVKDDGNWPYNHIDWDDAAEELKNGDYTEVIFGGYTYYVRTY